MSSSSGAAHELDAGSSSGAPADAASSSGAPADAASSSSSGGVDEPDRLTVHPRRGAEADGACTPPGTMGPLLLDSGAAPRLGLGWQRAAIGCGEGEGDLVVLSAGLGDRAEALRQAGQFASAQTLSLGAPASAADFLRAASVVAKAEVVWFEGGDQAHYVRWRGSPLMDAVQQLHQRGGGVGGSSAGMIVLGQWVNDALLTLSENLTSARLLADPFDPELHFTERVLHLSVLDRTITDPHFASVGRMGRLAAFMARTREPGQRVRGLAVDDGAAMAIDRHGVARRVGDGGSVYVVQGDAAAQLQAGRPLRYLGLQVDRLSAPEHAFDLRRGCGRTLRAHLDVDGALDAPYSLDPYRSGVLHDDCAP